MSQREEAEEFCMPLGVIETMKRNIDEIIDRSLKVIDRAKEVDKTLPLLDETREMLKHVKVCGETKAERAAREATAKREAITLGRVEYREVGLPQLEAKLKLLPAEIRSQVRLKGTRRR